MKKLILLFNVIPAFVFAVTGFQVVEERLREEILKELSPDARITIENIHTPVPVPNSASLVSVSPRPALGVIQFRFSWMEKGKAKDAFGNAVVKGYIPVVVARSPIKHGEIFDSSNVAVEEREITYLRGTGYFTELKKIFSLKANGYLAPGAVVGFGQTQEPYLVQQGQAVELINKKGTLKVTARVIALENGKKNQWIRVENPNSKKSVRARVASAGEVYLK